MSELKNKCILELASSEEDVTILNTKLVDFMVKSEKFDPAVVEKLVAKVLIVCREASRDIEVVSVSLATALFMIYNQSSPVCLVDTVEPVVKKVN